jgi:hypothetical protein
MKSRESQGCAGGKAEAAMMSLEGFPYAGPESREAFVSLSVSTWKKAKVAPNRKSLISITFLLMSRLFCLMARPGDS